MKNNTNIELKSYINYYKTWKNRDMPFLLLGNGASEKHIK
jgi:hypothetical protein